MLQKSKSKTIAKAKYIVLLPLIMLMLTYVACSEDNKSPSSNSALEIYNYTLTGGDEKSSEENAKAFENFLVENPGYVAWSIVDHEKEIIEYSIHSKNEEVPEDYNEYSYFLANGEESDRYVKEIRTDVNTTIEKQKGNEFMDKDGTVPFAVIEQVPVFPGCEDLASNEEQKKCMSEKIQEYVNKNFNTSLGKELNLKGTNRIIVQFKIDNQGNIKEVRSRAPHPDLEVEAERVINSLPSMQPGKQGGVEVGVMYSLPIVYQVNE